MRTKGIKENKNLQVPGEKLADKELVKLVKDAEKGDFIPLDKHNKEMNEWIKKNSR